MLVRKAKSEDPDHTASSWSAVFDNAFVSGN